MKAKFGGRVELIPALPFSKRHQELCLDEFQKQVEDKSGTKIYPMHS
jgi:hypothetical protein